jgi:transcriptional regulator with XRE-family HTH domain
MELFNSQKIKELCKKNNMTLKELSEKIGLSQTGLQGIFKNNSTSIETLQKICQVFNVSVEYFFSPIEEVDLIDEDGTILPARVKKAIDVSESGQSMLTKLEEQVEDKQKIIIFLEDMKLIDLAVTAETIVRHFIEKGISPADLDSLYEKFFSMKDFDQAVQKHHVRDNEMIKKYEIWKSKAIGL